MRVYDSHGFAMEGSMRRYAQSNKTSSRQRAVLVFALGWNLRVEREVDSVALRQLAKTGRIRFIFSREQ